LQQIWLAVTFMYLALLQIIAIILAIQTRKVKIKILNDSKYIAAIIYSSSIALVIVVASTLSPIGLIDVVEFLFTGALIVATTLILALVFIPKVINFG